MGVLAISCPIYSPLPITVYVMALVKRVALKQYRLSNYFKGTFTSYST